MSLRSRRSPARANSGASGASQDSLFPLRAVPHRSPHTPHHAELVPEHHHDTRHRRSVFNLATSLTVTHAAAKFLRLRGSAPRRDSQPFEHGHDYDYPQYGSGDDHYHSTDSFTPSSSSAARTPPLVVIATTIMYLYCAGHFAWVLYQDGQIAASRHVCAATSWPTVAVSLLEDFVVFVLVAACIAYALRRAFGPSQHVTVLAKAALLFALEAQFRRAAFTVGGSGTLCNAFVWAHCTTHVWTFALGGLCVALEILAADPFHRFGYHTAFASELSADEIHAHLAPPGQPTFPYFLGPVLILWSTPAMSTERLALAISSTVWLVMSQPMSFALGAHIRKQLFP